MLSELKRAFEIGFPALRAVPDHRYGDRFDPDVDGHDDATPIVISLPFKLIFFVLVDGWRLVAGSLVASYGAGITPPVI